LIECVIPDAIAREAVSNLDAFVPLGLLDQIDDQTLIPRIAKNTSLTSSIERSLPQIPTTHSLWNADSRLLSFLPDESVHLVVTSPPYWTLKEYNPSDGQMGSIIDYEEFLAQLDRVWTECYRVLVPGGRLVCVVGDVCLSRRRNGGGFLGKPYEPNGVIKNDIEFILMQRKPGGYRAPSAAARILSVIPANRHKVWFQQIWSGLTGASTRHHPAPYPIELAERLVRMFSFVGDTVLDPFMGTGSTSIAAGACGRNSVGVEVDPEYFKLAQHRVQQHAPSLLRSRVIRANGASLE
jgi:DNA modification methylase